MVLKFKKKIRYVILVLILKLKRFKLKNAIVICSDPRGGSTWLMEIFAELPLPVINLEPLHANSGVVPKKFNLGWYPSVSKESSDLQLEQVFFNILTFKVFNKWTTGFVSVKKLIWSKVVVTKFVLVNQMLPWLVTRFGNKLKYKPVYLVRHPIPTCMSQLKTFHGVKEKDLFKSLKGSVKFVTPSCNFNERFKKHEVYINSLDSKIERHIALWCINNGNLFNHEDSDKWITLFYEDLVISPLEEVVKLFNKMKIPFKSERFEKFNFQKPSHSNFNNEYKSNPVLQLESFLAKFSKEELQRLQSVLDYFKIVQYSAFNAYPIKGQKEKLQSIIHEY
jgi:hypothetical protein